jgi:hypothetical protein
MQNATLALRVPVIDRITVIIRRHVSPIKRQRIAAFFGVQNDTSSRRLFRCSSVSFAETTLVTSLTTLKVYDRNGTKETGNRRRDRKRE